MNDKEKELVVQLCQYYEIYGAITECKDKQIERMGIENYPSLSNIKNKVIEIAQSLGLYNKCNF